MAKSKPALSLIFGRDKSDDEESESDTESEYGEGGEFETAAADALGTDDPDAIASLKQAILACIASKE